MPFSCAVCGSGNVSTNGTQVVDHEYGIVPDQQFTYHRCKECRSESLNPRPSPSELIGFYPKEYHAYHDDHGFIAALLVALRSRMRALQYARMIREGRKGFLFDVGAGDCRHFDSLKRYLDIEFAGVELKPDIAEKARQKGYDIQDGDLESLDITGKEQRFEIVSMYHLIEHVIDPPKVLAKAYRMLRLGGFVIGQLPCVNSWERGLFGNTWAGYHFPRHLQAFSRSGLEKALAVAGFVDIRITGALHLQSALSIQNWLISKGWRPHMIYGKSPIYSALLIGVMPFEMLAWLFSRAGIINFSARRPETE